MDAGDTVGLDHEREIRAEDDARGLGGVVEREDMAVFLERPVHLFLHVKLKENWSEERARYEAMGLDWESSKE